MRILAGLFEPIGSETPFGGRSVSWQARGSAWLKLDGRRRRERTEAGVTRVVEAATAETRSDPRLVEGRMLKFAGGDWTIVLVATDEARPGRVKLSLERER